MLIIDRISTIVMSPPKCGSTSIHYRWSRDDVGGFWVLGPQPDGSIGKHTFINIPEYPYKRVSLIREPYDRTLSLWKHKNDFDNVRFDLDDFIDHLLASDHWFLKPQITFMSNVDEMWPIESIDRRTNLPKLPRLNVGTIEGCWSNDQKKRLYPLLKDDIDLWVRSIKQT